MKMRFMQAVDQYAGQVVCGIVSFLYKRNKQPPSEIRDIAIIKMFGIGSIILMTPAVRAIRRKYPEVRIHFVTMKGNETVPPLYGITDKVHAVSRASLFSFFADTTRALMALRKTRMDMVLDAEFFSRYTTLFSFLLKAEYRSGFYNRVVYRGNLIDFHAYFNPYRHMKVNFLELTSPLSPADAGMELSAPNLPAPGSPDQAKPLILMNPNVSDTSPLIDRSWPLDHFAALSRHVQTRGFEVAFIGSPLQKERTEKAAALAGATSLAGKLSLPELLALMSRSFMIFTNDSGPLHMAVSVNLPAWSFFGTESPALFGHAEFPHRIFCLNRACSPCLSVLNHKWGVCEFNSRCMREITPQSVIEAFEADLPRLRARFERRR